MNTFMDLSKGAKILLAIASVVVLAEGAFLYYVQTKPALNSCRYLIAQWEKNEPNAAAAKEAYSGPIAPVNFESTNFPQAKQFQSAITEAVAAGPNFAGHFVIAEIGCGANCQDHAIVDVVTGNIVAYGIPSEAGLSFVKESSLIMTNPPQNAPSFSQLLEAGYDEMLYWFNVPREYYALSEGDGRVSVRRLCIENGYDAQLR